MKNIYNEKIILYVSLVYNNIMKESKLVILSLIVILICIVNLILIVYSIFNPDMDFNSITSLLNCICILLNAYIISFQRKKD